MTEPPSSGWPDLSALDLQPTLEALHLWSQILGKVRLMKTPWVNQGWHVALHLSARGLTTGLISDGFEAFEIELDLLHDLLRIQVSDGRERCLPLQDQSTADFYQRLMTALCDLQIEVRVNPMPCELPGALPFDQDHAIRAYDGATARAYWRALLQVQRLLELFRTRFVGKCSPVHLFCGSFDLAVTRFSGRTAPRHPGGAPHIPDAVAREAYSEEVSSAGFWPGFGVPGEPSFYSYAYPAPDGFAHTSVAPAGGRFDADLGEFLLSYQAVRTSPDPDEALMSFLQSTYVAAADRAGWDRDRLERPQGEVGQPPVAPKA